MTPEKPGTRCRFLSRPNWLMYCVGCGWHTRYGCEMDERYHVPIEISKIHLALTRHHGGYQFIRPEVTA
jgi:hypothetical protein